MDIHQSKKYGQYMEKIGWMVKRVDGCQIFICQFPLIGSLIKIQRPDFPIPFEKIEKIAKNYRAVKIVIEPGSFNHLSLLTFKQFEKNGYKKSNSLYLPTKTIHLDLTQPEEKILSQMKKKTRYCLRQAQKKGLVVEETGDIESFIRLKSRQFFPLGFLIKRDIRALWQSFYPERATLLLSYYDTASHHSKVFGGVLLLFHRFTAHYWLAASTREGKKLFAPTLLVWEGVKLSKKRGCRIFDFEGIYDSRFHQATKSWRGFTHFKKGFGGKEIEYPGCFVKRPQPLRLRPIDTLGNLWYLL